MNIEEKYLRLRREIIRSNFENLNEIQQKAVMKTEGPLLILAGAGSGKTTVIVNRIVNILKFGCGSDCDYVPEWISQDHIDIMEAYLGGAKEDLEESVNMLCAVNVPRAYEILAITFTNKAAGELKERLEKAVGADAADIWAHTFHAACLRILRRDITKLGYSKEFTIYDEDDKKRLITSIIKDLNMDEKRFDIRGVISEISHAKDRFENAAEYAINAANDYYKSNVAKIYTLYSQKMFEANALDFDDIIIKTVELLYNFEDVREYYQRKFKYVLVDEYQDTNHAQYLLCSLLAGGYNNICVVGDDDQSIYKFRGATIRNILEFEKEYKDAVTIRLEQNYRSTTNILSAANEVIACNMKRKGKKLWTKNGDGDKVVLYTGGTQEDEAEYISREILKKYESGVRFSDFTVLYRSHVLSNAIETSFKRNGIPYRIVSGLRFFDRAEVKDMLAYLWLVANPADNVRLNRIINVPARKIGPKAIEAVSVAAELNQKSLFEICRNADEYPETAKYAEPLMSFARLIDKFRSNAEEGQNIGDLYEDIMHFTGYYGALAAKDDKESKMRIENILELKSNILDYEERTEEPSLYGFLEEIALFTDLDNYDPESDAVNMMTMHSAKGLEFDTVFICGMEDGIFPSYRSSEDQDSLEEERRLCYVAMTRAKKTLYMLNCKRRVLYGQTTFNRPSRFLDEIPEEYTENRTPKVSESYSARIPVSNTRTSAPKMPKYSISTSGDSKQSFTPSFAKGDIVVHSSFGKGEIMKTVPMGGDALLEIVFESAGKKMMMEKTASKYMKKA